MDRPDELWSPVEGERRAGGGRGIRSSARAVRAAPTFLLLLGALALAQETPKPETAEQAVQRVLAAVEAGDEAALKTLAARDVPDPWTVAETLCFRGRKDAALAFADAASRPDVEGLAAYVRTREIGEADREADRALAKAIAALGGGNHEGVLRALSGVVQPGLNVLGYHVVIERAHALRETGRHEKAVAAFVRAHGIAERLGWRLGMAEALKWAAVSAMSRGDVRAAREFLARRLAVEEVRRNRAGMAKALQNLGRTHRILEEYEEGARCAERCLEIYRDLGDTRGIVMALTNLGVCHLKSGDLPSARERLEEALALSEKIGYRSGVGCALLNLSSVHHLLGENDKARVGFERTLAILQAEGDRAMMAATLVNLGFVLKNLGDHRGALVRCEQALSVSEQIGDRPGVVKALVGIGQALKNLGRYREALERQEHALRLAEKLGMHTELVVILKDLSNLETILQRPERAVDFARRVGEIYRKIGDRDGIYRSLALEGSALLHVDPPRAVRVLKEALDLMGQAGDQEESARTIGNLGQAYHAVGDLQRALSCQRRTIELCERAGNQMDLASGLLICGHTHLNLGELASALGLFERALEIFSELEHKRGVAGATEAIAGVHLELGDTARALAGFRRALELHRELRLPVQASASLGLVAIVLSDMGEYEEGVACVDEALSLCRGPEYQVHRAGLLVNAGRVHERHRSYAKAAVCYGQALPILEEHGDPDGIVIALGGLAMSQRGLGDREEAVRLLSRAVREAERRRLVRHAVISLVWLGQVRLELDEPGRSLMAARRALRHLESMVGGLADEEGSLARERFSGVFEVGALAAARLDEIPEALTFLESGRAGTLLESMGDTRALSWAEIPGELRQAQAEAEAGVARARREYAKALDSEDRREAARCARALDDAQDELRSALARIQREAKRQAGLLYPRAATLEEIQGWLDEGQALVLYGLCLEEALALVLTPDGERIIDLGPARAVVAACEACRFGAGGGPRGLKLGEEAPDPRGAIDRLHALLVAPLGLPETAKTVLVSPEGPLCYVPWGALLPDVSVALTPSGTTHVLLAEEPPAHGEAVLALGDPEYGEPDAGALAVYRGGTALAALPGTKEEASTVGDRVLLGPEATKARLASVVAEKKRWRAVHLACHGLVHPERPALSSLALTRAGEDDGFLTAREVVQMKIPADLAVLSACETGKGKVVKGEGILGLTRAFMYAGAPRVLCSLWKVDDAATKALMVRFYELWNPVEGEGLPAAEALRRAQAFVRGQEKWEHPYFWAAWVLWGLP